MTSHDAFLWDDEFAVHSEEIDVHQQSLDSLVGDLRLLSSSQPAGTACASDGLAALLHYAQLHFAAEEQFMRRHGYDRSEAHAREHAVLLDGIRTLHRQLERNEIELVPELVDCLAEALADHLTGEERLYGEFVCERLEPALPAATPT